MGEGVDKIAVGVVLQALQGHGAAGGIADEALQLIAPMRRDLGVRMERNPVDTGTAGARERWRLALVAKPRADAPDFLASPLPKGDALLYRGGHSAGELGCVIDQWVIACRHCGVEARFQ